MMNPNPGFLAVLLLLLILPTPLFSQDMDEKDLRKSFYVEVGGSSMALLSANYDFRFKQERHNGLGMRLGVGYTPKVESFWTSLSYFTIPVEINYILSEKPFALEVGCSLTFVHAGVENPVFQSVKESKDGLFSYVPIGFRFQPKMSNFLLKANLGPRIDYLNFFSDREVGIFGGIAIGYSFY